jgi:hypothetical protein
MRLHFMLCRVQDVLPCCRNLAYFANGKLWCEDCKRGRGKLSPTATGVFTELAKAFPVGTMEVPFILCEDENERADVPETALSPF